VPGATPCTAPNLIDILLLEEAKARFAGNPDIMSSWKRALAIAVQSVDEISLKVREGKAAFPGDAGIYGTIAEAMEPTVSEGGLGKFLQNWLLGNRGARDAVKGYFLGILSTTPTIEG